MCDTLTSPWGPQMYGIPTNLYYTHSLPKVQHGNIYAQSNPNITYAAIINHTVLYCKCNICILPFHMVGQNILFYPEAPPGYPKAFYV